MKYIEFKTVRSWELALSPRGEGRYSALTFRSGAIYRVKIGERYELTFSRDVKGNRIFTLYCGGMITDQEIIPRSAPLSAYTGILSDFAQWGEELEYEGRHPEILEENARGNLL